MSTLRRHGQANLLGAKSLRRNSASAIAVRRAAKVQRPGQLERLGTWGERTRKLLVNIAGALTALLFVYLGWQQIRSAVGADLVEILPFEIGEKLTKQGMTGRALAAEVATVLRAMSRPAPDGHGFVRTENQAGSFALVNGGNTLDIQVPGTGMRFKDLVRGVQAGFAQRRFEVTGNVVETPTGLQVRIQVNRIDSSAQGLATVETDVPSEGLAAAIGRVVANEVNPQSLIRHELTAARGRCGGSPSCDFSSGIELIKRLARKADTSSVAFAYLAWCYALGSDNKLEEAIDKCRFAAQIDPKNDITFRNWGIALNLVGKFPEAEEKFRTSLRLQPKNPVAAFGLGDALWMQNRKSESLQAFDAGAQLAPVSDWPLMSWGSRLLDQKRLREGTDKLQLAVEQHPLDAQAWKMLAVARSEAHDYEPELAAWRAVIELAPEDAGGYAQAGFDLNQMKRSAEAIPMFERTEQLAKEPNDRLRSRLGLGFAYLESKQYDKAITAFRKSREIRPTGDAFVNVGIALSHLGRDEEALSEYQQAINLDPDRYEALENWADSLLKLQRYPEALEKSGKAIELAKRHGESQKIGYINRAHAEFALNRLDAAVADYRMAAEMDPKLANAFRGWADTLEKQGRASEAAEVRQRGGVDKAPKQ